MQLLLRYSHAGRRPSVLLNIQGILSLFLVEKHAQQRDMRHKHGGLWCYIRIQVST